MNAVLSGNIFNSFDNYAPTNMQEQDLESNQQMPSPLGNNSPMPTSPEGESSILKTDFGLSGESSPNSRQVSQILSFGSTRSKQK